MIPKVIRTGTTLVVDLHGDNKRADFLTNGEAWALIEELMAAVTPREYPIPETNRDE